MNVLLLAPKHARGPGSLGDYRSSIATVLETRGYRPIILEKEPDEADQTLRGKFLRLAAISDQAVLVWPEGAAMATTADEIVLLQEVYDQTSLEIVLILHEREVDLRDHELHVHFPGDQSRYLDGILACHPFIIPWPTGTPFSDLVDTYVDSFL